MAESNISPDIVCPVCLQKFVHPSRLPCSHVFCYLCVKGVVNKNNRCAMCRQNIPLDYLENPVLVHDTDNNEPSKPDNAYHWYYEGRNGFWQYDLRTSTELEEAFNKEEKSCTILVAGYLYVVDFEKMVQIRQSDTSRQRRVKRDLESMPKKGVAGLRIDNTSHSVPMVSTTADLDTSASSTLLLDRSQAHTTDSDGNLRDAAVPVELSSGRASPRDVVTIRQNTPSSSQEIADIFVNLLLGDDNVTPNEIS